MGTASQLRDEIYDLEAAISDYHLLRYSKKDLEIFIAGFKDPNSRIGTEVRRNTTGSQYQGTGIIVKIESTRAQVQWAENRTWYALDKLIEV